MTAGLRLEVTATPAPADRRAIGGGLAAHNRAAHGPRLPRRQRWILARDPGGALFGGARCRLAQGWLYLDWLWVEEARRRQGTGQALLAAAEALARESGCRGVHLHTWSFQAPGFYRRHGYAQAGRIEDMPPGATRHWFAKRF